MVSGRLTRAGDHVGQQPALAEMQGQATGGWWCELVQPAGAGVVTAEAFCRTYGGRSASTSEEED